MKARFLALALLLAAFCAAEAQPLALQIKDVRTNNLPVIRFKAGLFDTGMPVQQPGSASYTLAENGRPVQFEIDCPDGADNYVALVLDNSASMSGQSFDALKVAAHRFIDSLKSNDQTTIYDFTTTDGRLVLDFTANKTTMHNALDGMSLGGSTPLYTTTWKALQALAGKPGRKFCIIFTDGANNSGSILPEEIIAFAVANNITLFTIGFGNGSLSDDILRAFAAETGGVYYRIFSSDRLNEIFDAIASEVISTWCNVTYTTGSCTDSIRILEMTAVYDGRTASAVEQVDCPWRPDTVYVYIEAPVEAEPGKQVIIYVRLAPKLDTGLPLSFSFTVRYDPAFFILANSGFAITSYTIAQESKTRLDSISPGVLRLEAAAFETVVESGNLVGFALFARQQDSSRRVAITIDSLVIRAGCPNTVFIFPDSIDVCMCKRIVAATTPPDLLFGGEFRMPVMVADTAFKGAAVFRSEVEYDPQYFTFIDVDPVGSMAQNAALEWRLVREGLLEVAVTNSFQPLPGEALYYVRFMTETPKSAQSMDIIMPVVRAYSDCCPQAGPDDTSSVMLDGLCDKIVRRRGQATIQPASPNPARGATQFRFTVHAREYFSSTTAVVTLYNSSGDPVAEVYNGRVTAGEYNIPFSLDGLPAGTYYYTLSIDGSAQTRSLVVVK